MTDKTNADRIRAMSDTIATLQAENGSKDKRISRVEAERDAAIELLDKVNDVAIGALESGPYQGGEEAKIFYRIAQMTLRGAQGVE